MQLTRRLLVVTTTVLLTSSQASAEVVWGVDSNADSLYRLDLVTGDATIIGPLHPDPTRYTTPVAMAVRPSDGVIFVNNNSPEQDNGLATVDPDTGLATLIGGSYIDGALAFDDSDNLYAADATGALAIIDQTTGDPTPLGGPVLSRLFGLDFNRADGLLYGITTAPPGARVVEPVLLVIDPSDGALLDTRPLDTPLGGSAPGTLLFDSSGTLHGTVNDFAQALYEIDPATGAVSNIHSSDRTPQGLGLIGPEYAVDIKPGSCPNSFNRRSNGVLPVALVGTDAFDVNLVDISSLEIARADGVGGSAGPNEGPPGPHTVVEDVTAPFVGETCECDELLPDGEMDLSMKFKSSDVVEALELDDLSSGAFVELEVSGTLLNGTEFAATDCIRLVPPGDLNGDGVTGVPDLLVLLGAWGSCLYCGDCPADLEGNCEVGVVDMIVLLANWG
jgi:hypothetical protein